jgi:type II secretory pathway component PulF
MKFFFKAKNKEGLVREGTIDAVSKDAAVDVLQKNELFPIFLNEKSEQNLWLRNFLKNFDSVSNKELMLFFRQLAILIEAKVPIINALKAIEGQSENGYLKQILEGVINDIQDGLPFSDALQKNKDVFSDLMINVIRSGEASGNLRKSVEYVADNIEKNYTLTNKVKSALMYPMIIMIVFFIIGFIVMTFVVPKLVIVIKDSGVENIPWYTNVVISVSDFMSSFWWTILIALVGIIGGFWYYIRTESGRKEWDYIKLKLPVVGSIFRNLYISRFADNFGILLTGGIPIIRAITLVSSVINNSVYQALFLKVAEEVKIGGSMSSVMEKSEYIPPIVSQMIKIGEESGQIDLVLGHVAKYYEQETDMAAKNLATLIEPVVMVIIGVAVGVLVFSILMPIYNIAGQIN